MTPDNTSSATAEITIQADQPKAISSDLFGIFFEDLNYAADGGLYAELIQNRSFEYSSADHRDWNFLTAWELIQRNGGKCSLALETEAPIYPDNLHYLVLNIEKAGGEVGLRNSGFDGIALKAGEYYNVSLFARALHGDIGPFTARLESRTGEILGEARLEAPTGEWAKTSATITCHSDDGDARFVVLVSGSGSLALDVISLFSRATFCNRPNGLRADLAQAIADLRPRFLRFPGGCLAHGDGLENMYRWKDTIGSIEMRKEQPNMWGYHQSVGLGYFEYFQFCEDIGAKPVPVVAAGVSCQNSGASLTGLWGQGQSGLPLEAMPVYIQEVLDLIEWANGPATSTWGGKRAEAGHPEPFNLEYLGVGNEDHITPAFKERFEMIYEAVKAKHPEITVIGTVGPFHSGEDYDEGWKIANELKVPMVDEHYYEEPGWFWENLNRYDSYDRAASTVYLGEYAAHEKDRKNTLRSALAEAAYLTSLERNGDVVRLASYAPLLAKVGHFQWVTDLIYFDNRKISLTINYYVQQLFGTNAGDIYLPTTVNFENGANTFDNTLAASCVQDSVSSDLIVKLVSRAETPVRTQIDLGAAGDIGSMAVCTVISGDPLAENAFAQPPSVLSKTSRIEIGKQFTYDVPAHSLSVIRVKTQSLA
jgi:alpha-N-arabinofuranosidase